MTLAETLKQYLEANQESKRGLSLRSGLGEKVVSDILRIPGLRPRATTLTALSRTTGIDLFQCLDHPPVYYADLIARFDAEGEKRKATRVRWLTRVAKWVPEITIVCRRDVIEFLRDHRAAEFNLTKGSYATYSSEAIEIVNSSAMRNRKRGSRDLTGTHAEILAAISAKECDLREWQVGVARPFLVFLHDQQILVPEVTTDTLAAYYAERMETSSKSEEKCRQHVIEVAKFLKDARRIELLQPFGFCPVETPFEKYAGKYGVADEVVSEVMMEFDRDVAPWAIGEVSRTGQPLAAFIQELDKCETSVSVKKALLKKRRAENAARPGQKPVEDTWSDDDLLAQNGFLTDKQKWSARTLKTRRGYIASLAKSMVATLDIVPESLEELLDPDFLHAAADGIRDANVGEFSSSYLGSVLKCARKIAKEFQCRSKKDLKRIKKLIKIHDRKRRGIAPRNKAKLREFDDQRIQRTIDLGDVIITDVNAEIDRRRVAHRKKHGVLPSRVDVIDAELGRNIMAAIAHEILLRNAPRSDNLINARLDWISWRGEVARITVPALHVKMRGPDDDDLTLFLNGRQSKLLRSYLDTVRAKCLVSGDDRNPYLFPAQVRKEKAGQPYKTVLKRVTRILNDKVGSRINPHLYRHLIGWIWLKQSIDNLPKVQRMLGHASLPTTIDYYAELDPSLVFDAWNEHLNNKSSTGKVRAA
ncbi:tyrosine-type recombinase/integrase [Pseudosulfitobacter koreensis]|uniref:Tyrosine-type recombinase/integrase n=1 Tax=Pseudosulfitobacter koreensis TaxID=2968472 RepID=A0ABT1Z4H7_9RHOB|nr:tyrosine-type recombinase/integrase [Pseudosulfitobacter koreense]MCR8828046.1 tyrosine-type recombinase/integrase [Pseudosulfitobacter koreense]